MPRQTEGFRPIAAIHAENRHDTSTQRPKYLSAAESAAFYESGDPDDILAGDSTTLEHSRFPTSDCLSPAEIEGLLQNGTIHPRRLQHVSACDFCRLVVKDRI
jgi:hypothetical protein